MCAVAWQALISSNPIEHIIFRYVTRNGKCCCSHFYISKRHKCCVSMGRRVGPNPQRAAFLAQWSPAGSALSKCWQVKLVYIIIRVSLCALPPRVFITQLIYRLERNCKIVSWNSSNYRCSSQAPNCNLFILSLLCDNNSMEKGKNPPEKSGLTWLQKWDVGTNK